MQQLHIAICDDDVDILQVVAGSIKTEFAKYDYNADIELFGNPLSLEKRMQEKAFDLLFLDIEMPGEDGITLARKVHSSRKVKDIIFISSREDKVFDALRTGPNGFIRKKRFLTDVPEVIRNYVQSRKDKEEDSSRRLVIQGKEGTISIKLAEIIYIEGQQKNQELYLTDRKEALEIHRSMQELEETLAPEGFLRIHKGYLVNYRYIRHIDNAEVILTNGTSLPMSRRRVQEIRDTYLKLMQNTKEGIVML